MYQSMEAFQVINNMKLTPNSKNYSDLRTSAAVCKNNRKQCREIIESDLWKKWLAKVDTDINNLMPKALSEYNSADVKMLLASYHDDTFVQARMLLKLNKACYKNDYFTFEPEKLQNLFRFQDSLVEEEKTKEGVSLPDIAEVALRVLLIASPSALENTRSYNTVMLIFMKYWWLKMEMPCVSITRIPCQSQVIGLCTHLLCQFFSKEVHVPSAYRWPYSEVWYGRLARNAKITFVTIIKRMLFDYDESDSVEYRLDLQKALCSLFTKITLCARICIDTRNTQPNDHDETKDIMDVYLSLLTHMRGWNAHVKATIPNLSASIRSLEETALQNIQMLTTFQYSTPVRNVIVELNRTFLCHAYEYRKATNLDYIKSAHMAVPAVVHLFLGKDGLACDAEKHLKKWTMLPLAVDAVKWLTLIVQHDGVSVEEEDLRTSVVTQCMQYRNVGSVFDVIALSMLKRTYRGSEKSSDALFTEFANFLACLCNPRFPSSAATIALLSTMNVFVMLISAIYTNIPLLGLVPAAQRNVNTSIHIVLKILSVAPHLIDTNIFRVVTTTRNVENLGVIQRELLSETDTTKLLEYTKRIQEICVGKWDTTYDKIVLCQMADKPPVMTDGYTVMAYSVTPIRLIDMVQYVMASGHSNGAYDFVAGKLQILVEE